MNVRDFLIEISYDWRDYAGSKYTSEVVNVEAMQRHFNQEYPLPFKFKLNVNLMGHQCSIHLTDFLIDENHKIVVKIMEFIREQARK